jgi:hypothetical protein
MGYLMKRAILVLLSLLPLNLYAQGAGTPPYRGVNNWNVIFGTDNTYDIGASGATRPRNVYVATGVFTPALTVSGLTATRCTFAGVGGLLSDDADCTFDGTRLTVTSATVPTQLVIPAGTLAATGTLLGNDADTWLGSVSPGIFSYYMNGTERVRMDAGGNLSITGSFSLGTLAGPDILFSKLATNVARCVAGFGGTTRCLLGGGAAVASASALPVPTGAFYHITGTTTVTSQTLTGIGHGTCFTLVFDAAVTVTDGSNLKLNGNFAADADDTLGLCCDSTNCYETHRSPN